MVIDEVKANIEEWLINFLEVPHPALGNWSPCPYARKARLANKYSVRIGTSLAQDMIDVAKEGMGAKMCTSTCTTLMIMILKTSKTL